ncbi:M16 family metallopeptidase [Leptolyngbya ohadii]|uniref:M16 family metallopeptidase n=1 Tax=Leptolyngbya ohadii TaxID=1962290 RepID=UPI000B59A06E|nr:pitrilysin family protein [Leptolyngbya ohadii]
MQNRIVHRAVLPNGMTVLCTENAAADIVAARIFIRAGGRYEPIAQAGLSHLLAAVMTKGTDRLTSQEIAERVESVGASLGADAAADYCLLSIKTVSGDFAEMLELAAELLRSPAFPEMEVELERRLTLQGIRSMQEQPFSVANNQLRQALYGQHPYALPGLGTSETVSSLTPTDLRHYHKTYFRPDNLVISIAGRIQSEAAMKLVEKVFGDWEQPLQTDGSVLPLPELELPAVMPNPQWKITPQDTQQAIVMLGYLASEVHSTDHLTLKLLNTYLGSGLSSRLFVELREKQGLAYEVSAFYPTRIDTSHFVAYIGTAPDNAAVALEGLRSEMERLQTILLSDEELQAAKNKLLGQYALGKQTNAQLAQISGWYETLQLGIDYDDRFQERIPQIAAADIQAVANRYFTQPYVSLVGSEKAIDLVEQVKR